MKDRRDARQSLTALAIMSDYAPPDDCVGSIGTPPNCPHSINPTVEYAARIAASVGKKSGDPLNLDGTTCQGRQTLYVVFREIATFEIGADFCGRKSQHSMSQCAIDRELFDAAMTAANGPTVTGSCDTPASRRRP